VVSQWALDIVILEYIIEPFFAISQLLR